MNLLPVPVKFAWKEAGANRIAETGVLTSGEERGLLCADVVGLGAEVCFKLQGPGLEGLSRSRWVRLGCMGGNGGGEGRGVRELELGDDTGGSFVILIDLADRGPHGITITLYVEVSWFGMNVTLLLVLLLVRLLILSQLLYVLLDHHQVWIENLTGLGLVYGEPRVSKAVETLAGPVSTDVVLSAVQVWRIYIHIHTYVHIRPYLIQCSTIHCHPLDK